MGVGRERTGARMLQLLSPPQQRHVPGEARRDWRNLPLAVACKRRAHSWTLACPAGWWQRDPSRTPGQSKTGLQGTECSAGSKCNCKELQQAADGREGPQDGHAAPGKPASRLPAVEQVGGPTGAHKGREVVGWLQIRGRGQHNTRDASLQPRSRTLLRNVLACSQGRWQ